MKTLDNKSFDELYNSAAGVVGIWHLDSEDEFEMEYDELNTNPDFTYLGQFDMTQCIDEELQYQGMSLDEITKMSLNCYGNVLEVLHYDNQYYAFIGAR